MTSAISHCTQFIVEQNPLQEGKEPTLSELTSREKNYDIGFCAAWKVVQKTRNLPTQSAQALFDRLDAIQKSSLNHLPEVLKINDTQAVPVQGKSVFPNVKGLSKNRNSNVEGIRGIIKKIWIERSPMKLLIHEVKGKSDVQYVLTPEKFYLHSGKGKTRVDLQFKEENKSDDLKKIFKRVMDFYPSGPISGEKHRLSLCTDSSPDLRQKTALNAMQNYLNAVSDQKDEQGKLRVIAKLVSSLRQCGLYWRGNDRSLYLLLNSLLCQNGLKPCYLESRDIFAGYSIARMMELIRDGQKRFEESFGTFEKLSEELEAYRAAVESLVGIVKIHYKEDSELKSWTKEREFVSLLCKSAENNSFSLLMKELLEHAEELGLDVHGKNPEGKSALQIAQEKGNEEAIRLFTQMSLID